VENIFVYFSDDPRVNSQNKNELMVKAEETCLESNTLLASAREYDQPTYDSTVLKLLSSAPLQARLGRHYLRINHNHSLYGFSSLIQSDQLATYSLVFLVDLEPILQSWAIASAQLIAVDDRQNVVMASDAPLIGARAPVLNQSTQQVVSSVRLNTLGWTVFAHANINTKSLRIFFAKGAFRGNEGAFIHSNTKQFWFVAI
jgi:hypothetical protein